VEPETPQPLETILATGLAELGLPGDRVAVLAELSRLVARWAERINLTAHRGPEAVARRLVLDAAALGAALPIVPPRTLADLGSGAGFPGLPLAVLWPGCQVTLIDSRERKHHFQRTAIRALELSNARAVRGRAESLDAAPHQIVVAQAMARPAEVLQWMRRWVAPDGWIVLAQSDPAPSVKAPAGVRFAATRRYRVPLGGASRSLWLGRPAGEFLDGSGAAVIPTT
jgi:16S rRNA (guanine527-N7)-methyltransferase